MCPRVEVVAATASVVAVHKPATVPAHPTGQYRKNTVLGVLAAERPDLGRLFPVHRLDKNVSGLLLLARDGESATRMCEEVARREVRKEYLALVRVFGPEREDESESESESSFESSSFLATVAKRWGVPPAPGGADGEEKGADGKEENDERDVPNVARGKASRSSPTGKSSSPPRVRPEGAARDVPPSRKAGRRRGFREWSSRASTRGSSFGRYRGGGGPPRKTREGGGDAFRDVTRRSPAARAKPPAASRS